MSKDFVFLLKYWKKHKRELLSVIISAFFLVIMLLVSGYLERTEIRRDLHSYYDVDGAFDVEYRNVDSDTINLIKTSKVVDIIGDIYCVGRIQNGDFSATVGAFNDKQTEELAHYPIIEGRLPNSKGEIALTKNVLQTISPLTKYGDSIILDIHTFNENEIVTNEYLIVGIIDDVDRTTFENPINGYEYCDPRVILSKEDANIINNGYNNILFQFKNGERMALSNDDNVFPEEYELNHECFERGYSISGNGRRHGIQIIAMSQDEDNIEISPKLKMVKIITLFSMLISIISMFSSLTIVLQNRMNSFQLMRCVGYSKKRIVRLLFIEMIIFFFIATIIGICLGILLYEGLVHIQVSCFKLPAFKGYNVEWIVEQKTIQPMSLAILVELITITISYVIIILKIVFTFSAAHHTKHYMYHTKVNSLYRSVNRILSQKGTTVLQIVSLSSVLFICVVGYLYCTPINKGNTVVSQTTLNINNSSKTYEVLDELDLKENGFDALLETGDTLGTAAYLSPHINYGLSETDVEKMKENGAKRVLCWSNWFSLVVRKENYTNNIIQSNAIPADYCEILGFKPDSLYSIPCIIVNEDALNEFATISSENNISDGAVWVSIFGDGKEFNENNTYCLYSFQADSTGWVPENRISTDFEINGSMKLNPQNIENSSIIRNIVNDLKNYSGFLLITGEYANQLGIYNSKYDKVLISGDSDEKYVESAIASIGAEAGLINKTTIFELKRKAIYQFVFNYLTIIILFILLFIIFIIGFGNILNLSLKTKSSSFAILRCLGLKKNKITKYIIASYLKIPLISSFISGVGIFFYRMILKNKYSSYCDLIDKRNQLYNAFGKEEEINKVKDALRNLKNEYLLGEEMWVPSWYQIFILLSCLIVVFSIVAVYIIQKKQFKNNLINELSKINKE